uniref:Glypican-1 n=1 Tax=Ornithorhynchus anatinus TaxID=9258 RepID=A0A6I8NAH1_ORNAN
MDFLRGFWLLYVAASCARGDTKTRSCTEVRQVYGAKGFSLSGVPQAEISGEHLRICPQGYTCCTSEMEENFANKSKSEFEGMLKDNSRSIQVILTIQFKNFDGYFQDLLNKSEKSLHDTFPTMYGELYSQNVKLFRDLYTELRRYYRGSNINLEEALTEFWTRLLERLFKLLNPQYLITDDYLDCMGKHSEQHKPFGEVPRELKLKATRAFIAVRSFVQGLSVGGDVVKKVSQVSFGQECSRAIMKLVYCSHCLGMPSILPCNNYCRNVMKGCLANQADLDTEWRNLIDSMLLVADKIDIPSNVETVIGNIHTKISEAISTMQENKDAITTKISDAKGKLKDIKDFWVVLPSLLCNEKVAVGSVNNDKCWNGMTRGRYLPEVMGDGLANQINNPEVEVDITKPDMTIRQQIMQLKIMTNRLRNAYNGNDVDFQDTSDDISGSGSGEGCLDEMCVRKTNRSPSTRQPETHAIPNQSDRNTNGASSHFLPSSFLLFLSLAIVATRYLWR